MRCRLILCENYDPFFNMAFDYFFCKECIDLNNLPVLRFYKWTPRSVSIGYNQNTENLINIEFCEKNKIPVVRRPTGGSAIFHDIEITYSFCANVSHHQYFFMPSSTYFIISNSIIKGLGKKGIKLNLRGFSTGKEPSFTDFACFSLSSKYDVVYNDKKIVGSAQRRNRFSFLQHGSILIDIRKNLWENIFLKEINFSKIGCLKEILNDIDEKELMELLINGFKETLNFEIFEDELKKTEEEKIEIIKERLKMEGKYE
jgi:lipoate-protein ligase A